MPQYTHPHSLVPWEWLYHATIYPPPLSSSMGVIISSHDISTLTHMIIRTLYFHSQENLMMGWIYRNVIFHSQPHLEGWLYRDIIFSPLTIFSEGVEYIMTLYFHSWQYLVRGWFYRDIIFSLLTIFGEGVNISWHYIFTPENIWWGGDYIVTLYFHSWHYLVRELIYRDIIFSLLTIFGEGVNIS